MARRATTIPEEQNPSSLTLSGEVMAANQLEVAARDADILDQWGEGLPYVRELYIADIRRGMGQVIDSVLTIGRRLIVMKALEPHGDWLECLRTIGLGEDNAQRMMAATRRLVGLSNTATSRYLLQAAGTPSKLFDLLALPDEQLLELVEGGEVNGMDLDDVVNMTVRELRAAVREAKADLSAKDEVAASKEKQIEKLTKQLTAAKRTWDTATPEEKLVKLREETEGQALVVRSALMARGEDTSSLRTRINALVDHAGSLGEDQSLFLAGLLGEVERELYAIREDFGIPRDIIADEALAARREMGLEA